MGGEGVNTKSNGRNVAVVLVKFKEVVDENCQASWNTNSMEPVNIECMQCGKWFIVDDLNCMENKSVLLYEQHVWNCYRTSWQWYGMMACRETDGNSISVTTKEMMLVNVRAREDGHVFWQTVRSPSLITETLAKPRRQAKASLWDQTVLGYQLDRHSSSGWRGARWGIYKYNKKLCSKPSRAW